MPFKCRFGKLAVASVVLGAIGCSGGTEIPLAKVAPVTLPPASASKNIPKGISMSPANLGSNGAGR